MTDLQLKLFFTESGRWRPLRRRLCNALSCRNGRRQSGAFLICVWCSDDSNEENEFCTGFPALEGIRIRNSYLSRTEMGAVVQKLTLSCTTSTTHLSCFRILVNTVRRQKCNDGHGVMLIRCMRKLRNMKNWKQR